jgi:hypothetical protein
MELFQKRAIVCRTPLSHYRSSRLMRTPGSDRREFKIWNEVQTSASVSLEWLEILRIFLCSKHSTIRSSTIRRCQLEKSPGRKGRPRPWDTNQKSEAGLWSRSSQPRPGEVHQHKSHWCKTWILWTSYIGISGCPAQRAEMAELSRPPCENRRSHIPVNPSSFSHFSSLTSFTI